MSIWRLFILFSFMSIIFSMSVKFESEVSSNELVHNFKCFQDIIKRVIPCHNVVTIVNFPNTAIDFIAKMNVRLCHQVIIRNFDKCGLIFVTEIYVIAISNLQEFRKGIRCLSRDVYWKPSKRFVIILKCYIQEDYLREVFNILLKNKIFNAIVIATVDSEPTVYTYYPFENGSCGRKVGNISKIDKCNTLTTTIGFFPNETAANLRNCTLIIVHNEDIPNVILPSDNESRLGELKVGLEQFLILNVARNQNYTIKYKFVDVDERYGIVLPNGSATGILKYTQRGLTDVSSGGIMLILNRAEIFDFVWGYHYATYNLFTRTVIEQRWKFIYTEFDICTWILLLMSFGAIIIMMFFVKYISLTRSSKVYEPIQLIIILWGYLFTNTSSILNKNKIYRCVLLCWIWFSFFVTCFYGTALYSLITGKVWSTEYKDLNYFVEFGYKPCISKTTRDFFIFAYNQTLPTGAEDRAECQVTEDCLKTVASEKNSYAVEAGYIYNALECSFMDNEGRALLENWYYFGNIITVLYFQKGSQFQSVFEKYTRYLFESGLFDVQEQLIKPESSLACQQQKKIKVFDKLHIEDLRIPFVILITGWLLSIGVFVIEYYFNRQNSLIWPYID